MDQQEPIEVADEVLDEMRTCIHSMIHGSPYPRSNKSSTLLPDYHCHFRKSGKLCVLYRTGFCSKRHT